MKWLKYFLIFLNQVILFVNAQDFRVLTWRDHLPYNSVKQLAKVNDIFYASTPHSIIEFDNSLKK